VSNISQLKWQRMLEFLQKLSEEHKDDDGVLIAIRIVRKALSSLQLTASNVMKSYIRRRVLKFRSEKDFRIFLAPLAINPFDIYFILK
jgi:hypothetical protein